MIEMRSEPGWTGMIAMWPDGRRFWVPEPLTVALSEDGRWIYPTRWDKTARFDVRDEAARTWEETIEKGWLIPLPPKETADGSHD